MTYCEICGKKLNHSLGKRCKDCRHGEGGRQRGGDDSLRGYPGGDIPIGLSMQEFRRSYSKGARLCNTAAVFGYASAALMLGIFFFWFRDFSAVAVVDVTFVLLLTLLAHLTKNRAAALIYLAYCVLNAVIYLLTEGRFVAMLPLIGAILAVAGTFWYDREWRAYQAYAS